MSDSDTIPVLERTTTLVTAIADSPHGLTAKELVLQLEIPQATCYRILRTLVHCGWLQQSGDGLYRTAHGLARLARSWTDLETRLAQVRPRLEALAESTGLSAKISILEGACAVIVARSRTQRPNSIVSPVGSRNPLAEAGSAGVMLLAALSPVEQEAALKKVEPVTRVQLLKAAAAAARQGIARAYGSDHPAIFAVSVALEADLPVVLTLVGWPEDFAGTRKAERERALQAAAPELSLRAA